MQNMILKCEFKKSLSCYSRNKWYLKLFIYDNLIVIKENLEIKQYWKYIYVILKSCSYKVCEGLLSG